MPISKYDYIIVYYKEFWPCGLIRRMTSDEGVKWGGGGVGESLFKILPEYTPRSAATVGKRRRNIGNSKAMVKGQKAVPHISQDFFLITRAYALRGHIWPSFRPSSVTPYFFSTIKLSEDNGI